MAVLYNPSLPVSLHFPSVKRFYLPLPSNSMSSSRKLSHRQIVLRRGIRQRSSNWSLVADDGKEAPMPASVPVRVAHELLQAGHRYLDVRTMDEFNAGHVVGATNIAYMLKVGSGLIKNPDFLEEVSKTFGKDDEILVGCLSGKRSLMASRELSSMGFTGLTDVAGGYASWVQNKLPIEQ